MKSVRVRKLVTKPACPEVQHNHQVIVILEDIVNNIEGVHQVHRRSVERAKASEKYEGQGNCLALVLRSEGLVALPLIAASVTQVCRR